MMYNVQDGLFRGSSAPFYLSPFSPTAPLEEHARNLLPVRRRRVKYPAPQRVERD